MFSSIKQEGLNCPQQMIVGIKAKLDEIHERLAIDPMSLHYHKEQLTHWLALEGRQLRQKCKVDWLALGNRNTKFSMLWLR